MITIKRMLFKLLLISLVVLCVLTGQKTYEGLTECRESTGKKDELQTQIEDLKYEIKELNIELERLATDDSYYEQLGREEFGMVKSDEVVYIVKLP